MIAGAGFALMAWQHAQQLVGAREGRSLHLIEYQFSRATVEASRPGSFPVHSEYLRIIDEAARAFVANGAWHGCGLKIYL